MSVFQIDRSCQNCGCDTPHEEPDGYICETKNCDCIEHKPKVTSSPAELSFNKFLSVTEPNDPYLNICASDFKEWLIELKTNPGLDWHPMEHKLFNFLLEAIED